MTPHAAAICAAGALAVCATTAHGGFVDLGVFRNTGPGQIDYQGAFGAHVGAVAVDGHTRVDLDLAGILLALDATSFIGVQVVDLGNNTYGSNSPGADIDLFVLGGLAPEIDVTYFYEGPTTLHQGESSAQLAQRAALIDQQSGEQHWSASTFVSLGQNGTLTALLSSPGGGIDDTPGGFSLGSSGGPSIFLSEAGTGEGYRVLLMTVPSPGALALFALAGALRGRRRRV